MLSILISQFESFAADQAENLFRESRMKITKFFMMALTFKMFRSSYNEYPAAARAQHDIGIQVELHILL